MFSDLANSEVKTHTNRLLRAKNSIDVLWKRQSNEEKCNGVTQRVCFTQHVWFTEGTKSHYI